jgi:hypothetical protein
MSQRPPLAELTWQSSMAVFRARVLRVLADMADFHNLLNLSTPFQSPPCGSLPWRSSIGGDPTLKGRHLRHRTVGNALADALGPEGDGR